MSSSVIENLGRMGDVPVHRPITPLFACGSTVSCSARLAAIPAFIWGETP